MDIGVGSGLDLDFGSGADLDFGDTGCGRNGRCCSSSGMLSVVLDVEGPGTGGIHGCTIGTGVGDLGTSMLMSGSGLNLTAFPPGESGGFGGECQRGLSMDKSGAPGDTGIGTCWGTTCGGIGG